jgi:RNA polymerase sigma factor (sigma-70 family)
MPPAPAAPPSRAAREAMLAGVEKLILSRVCAFGVPAPDREDVVADIQCKLWELSERFDPDGSAKWSTFVATVAGTMCKAWLSDRAEGVRAGVEAAGEIIDLLTPGPASVAGSGDDGDEDDLAGHAGAVALAVRRQLAGPALAGLTPGVRRLVEQVVFDRLTVEQIAEQSGQPPRIVRTNLQAALGQLARAGRLPAALAARFGFDPDALAARVDKQAGAARTAARRELVAEALALGLTPTKIAAELGESVSAVTRDAHRLNGVRPKSSKAKPKVREWPADMPVRDRVYTLAGEGLGFACIAAELGVSLGTAEQHWRIWQREQAAAMTAEAVAG